MTNRVAQFMQGHQHGYDWEKRIAVRHTHPERADHRHTLDELRDEVFAGNAYLVEIPKPPSMVS